MNASANQQKQATPKAAPKGHKPKRMNPVSIRCEAAPDLREVTDDYLIAELIRRGYRRSEKDSLPVMDPTPEQVKAAQERRAASMAAETMPAPKRINAESTTEEAKQRIKQVGAPQAMRERKQQPSKPKGERKRIDVFGFPVSAVIRWMGKAGWTFEQAQRAFAKLEVPVADGTVNTFLHAGKKGQRGDPAALTAEQIKQLQGAAA